MGNQLHELLQVKGDKGWMPAGNIDTSFSAFDWDLSYEEDTDVVQDYIELKVSLSCPTRIGYPLGAQSYPLGKPFSLYIDNDPEYRAKDFCSQHMQAAKSLSDAHQALVEKQTAKAKDKIHSALCCF